MSVVEARDQWRQIDWRRAARVLAGIPVRFGLFLFLPAGTFIWPNAWVFMLVSLAEMIAQFGYLWRVNPEVVIARSHYCPDAKRWDKFLLCFYLPALLAILLVAGLDEGRYHWSRLPSAVSISGLLLFLLGLGLITWAEAVNKFFEPMVRIQLERGQRVIDRGPYSVVRHPGYLAGVLVAFGTALSLGSVWAVIPAALASALLFLRTKWEDATLQQELTGYQAYSARVCYKLIPGLW